MGVRVYEFEIVADGAPCTPRDEADGARHPARMEESRPPIPNDAGALLDSRVFQTQDIGVQAADASAHTLNRVARAQRENADAAHERKSDPHRGDRKSSIEGPEV